MSEKLNLDPLLSLIREKEARGDYDIVYSGIRKSDRPKRPITTMTVAEVLAWQDSIDPKYMSEAAGAYQVMEDTLRQLVRSGAVNIAAKFDEETQDKIAQILLDRRGLTEYATGQISREQFANAIAQEWASMPVVTPVTRKIGKKTVTVPAGASYYAGDGLNRSLVDTRPFLDAIDAIINSHPTPAAAADPVEEKPSIAAILIGAAAAILDVLKGR